MFSKFLRCVGSERSGAQEDNLRVKPGNTSHEPQTHPGRNSEGRDDPKVRLGVTPPIRRPSKGNPTKYRASDWEETCALDYAILPRPVGAVHGAG